MMTMDLLENILEVLAEMEEALDLNFVINLKVLKDIEYSWEVPRMWMWCSTSINLEKKKDLAQEICLECRFGWKNTMFSSNQVS